MSGGSFNYACFKVEDSYVFQGMEDVRNIESYLRALEKHDAADEVLLFIKEVETHQRRLAKIGQRIAPLLKAAEWHCSGDWSENSIVEAFLRLMGIEAKEIGNATE